MKRHLSFTLSVSCIVLLFISSGCGTLLYGLKRPKTLDEKSILSLEHKWNIPVADGYQMDTSYRAFTRQKRDSAVRKRVKNHYQPLQALYFSQNNAYPIRYYVNCDFPGKFCGYTFNLDFNDSGRFYKFLPIPNTPVDTLLSLTQQLSFLQPLSAGERRDIGGYDYVVFVYWSRFMGRQSRHFIKTIQKNVALAGGNKVKVLYVNNDAFLKGL